MKKNAFPYVGVTGMGATMDPKGEDFIDPERGSQGRYSPFVGHESISPDTMQTPVTRIEEGAIGHMENPAMDKEVVVEIVDEDEEDAIATFGCDVADSLQKKIIGLQSYTGLERNAGLIFPYTQPESVMYHMGTVSFPIDIIFVGEDDKIKKVYKNIKPGTLGTFGCAKVKNVLEIYGGLSERLGINIGNKVRLKGPETFKNLNKLCHSVGINKRAIIKHSNFTKTKFFNWNGFPILNLNGEDDLTKSASEKGKISELSESLLEKFSGKEKSISIFCFDPIINPEIPVHNVRFANEDEDSYLTIYGNSVSVISKNAFNLDSVNLTKNSSILFNASVLHSFLPRTDETTDLLDLYLDEYTKGSRVVIATSFKNTSLLKRLLSARINFEFGGFNHYKNVEILDVKKEHDLFNISELAKNAFDKDVFIFAPDELNKAAGTPIPDEVKEKAKKAFKNLEESVKIIEKSIDNMNQNLVAYQKIQDNVEAIPNTKGQYGQSVKRQTKVVRNYLLKIRDSIKILSDIKDVSTTMEIIDSIAESAKKASSNVEDIFDLIDIIDSPDFIILLGEKTANYEKTAGDLVSTLERGIDYISERILGIVVLST